ncbi:MAG: hypothetical protein ACYC3Q_07905 [Gemmatimonadaceae bacterium]
MKGRLLLAGAFVLAAVQPAQAQANSCPPGSTTNVGGVQIPDRQRASQDACQIAADMFQFMAPQLGLAITGGNTTLGQGGTLGGFPHFAVSVRANVFRGDIPQVDAINASPNGAQQRDIATKSQVVGLPAVDAAVGIFKGIPLGVTNVGGIDLLVSAAYVPSIGGAGDDFQVEPDQNLKLGFGARLGLLQESLLVPGVSVSYLKRDLPTLTLRGRSTDLDVDVTDASIKTSSIRVVASKSFLIFGITAGAGQDKYDQSAAIQGTFKAPAPIGNQTSDKVTLSQSLTRTNVFGGLSLNLPIFKLVAEVGQVSGGTGTTVANSFDGSKDVAKSRVYGSAGIRIGF